MDLVRDKIKDQVQRIEIDGSMDLYSVPELKEFIKEDPARHLILDLKGCDFIDSSGLGTLIFLKSHASPPCDTVCLVNASPRIQHLLELTGTLQQFPVFDSLEEALAQIAD